MPPNQAIVRGQRVKPVKIERSRELRKNMTSAEKLLWERLRGGQLNGLRWRRQQVIDGFIVDFYCHPASVVIELDGSVHTDQAEYDTARDDVLARRGLRILRFTNAAVETHIDNVLDQIRATCQQHIHSQQSSSAPPSEGARGESYAASVPPLLWERGPGGEVPRG